MRVGLRVGAAVGLLAYVSSHSLRHYSLVGFLVTVGGAAAFGVPATFFVYGMGRWHRRRGEPPAS